MQRVALSLMQRLTRNVMIPFRTLPRQRRWRGSPPLATRWTLLFASIALALLIWQTGSPWLAVLIGGGGALAGIAGAWWRWATRQSPPKRPTPFVIRHRQQHALRLLRSVEADLSQNIVIVEALVRQVDEGSGSVDANHDRGCKLTGVAFFGKPSRWIACSRHQDAPTSPSPSWEKGAGR